MSTWRCDLCMVAFSSHAARQAHVDASPRHPRCTPCARSFLSGTSLRAHLANSAAHNYCLRCSRDFADPARLQQHRRMAAVHRGEYLDVYESDDSMPTLYPTPHSEDEEDDSHYGSANSDDSDNGSEDEDEDEDEDDDEDENDEGIGIPFSNEPRATPDPNWHWSNTTDSGARSRTLNDREETNAAGPRAGAARQAEEEVIAETAELFFRMTFEDHMSRTVESFLGLPRDGSDGGARSPSWLTSDGSGDDGSYLDHSSSNEDSEDDDIDSDFLAHSDDESESDTSAQISYLQGADALRSTRTRIVPVPTPTSPPPPSSSSSLENNSASSSSSTLADSVPAPSTSAAKNLSSAMPGANAGYTCPLCLDQADDLSSVRCGHVFCTPCINRALDRKRQCPVCRASAKIKDVRKIYLTF
ncbi:hypothetical protein DFH11DRAFT_1621728 [Phellopilus nigrolimitatus]|nr:hypothetical protein DFH11DRAFT_1621728 [Phellopilus nigrolimitatus]